jgi:hypothetical protein
MRKKSSPGDAGNIQNRHFARDAYHAAEADQDTQSVRVLLDSVFKDRSDCLARNHQRQAGIRKDAAECAACPRLDSRRHYMAFDMVDTSGLSASLSDG